MARKMKIGDKRPVRPLGDGFRYESIRDHTPESFKKRMNDRAIAAVWDQAHEANRLRHRADLGIVEQISKRKRA